MTEQNASSPPRKQTADELVWAHATSPSRHAVLVDIARRLTHLRPTARVLITHEPNAITGPLAEVDNVTFESLPKDTSTEARAFLQEHKPDLCIWTGGHLRQQILKNTAQADIPSLLIDADEDGFAAVRRTWFYNPTRASLRMFSAILANGPNAAAALTRLGAPVDRITLTGQLKESQSPLQCSESDLDELNAGLSGRPVWLACYVQRDEVEPILNAHRKATRLSHRLLLVISMDKEEDINDARIAMGGSGFRWARWAPGQPVDDNTQVVLAIENGYLPLWLRVAPVTFIGTSLTDGCKGRHPFDAVALGSAVLFGPNVKDAQSAYTRLTDAGAARMVRNESALADGVLDLSAPDEAASMALAGWNVLTESAKLTDSILDLVQDMLDAREALNASP